MEMKKYKEALGVGKKLLEKKPYDFETRSVVIALLLQTSQEAAIEETKRGFQYRLESKEKVDAGDGLLSSWLIRFNLIDLAEEYYEKFLKDQKSEVFCDIHLRILLKQSRFSKSYEFSQKYRAEYPLSPPIQISSALTCYFFNKNSEASELLSKILAQKVQTSIMVEALSLRIKIRFKEGKSPKKVIEDFEELEKLNFSIYEEEPVHAALWSYIRIGNLAKAKNLRNKYKNHLSSSTLELIDTTLKRMKLEKEEKKTAPPAPLQPPLVIVSTEIKQPEPQAREIPQEVEAAPVVKRPPKKKGKPKWQDPHLKHLKESKQTSYFELAKNNPCQVDMESYRENKEPVKLPPPVAVPAPSPSPQLVVVVNSKPPQEAILEDLRKRDVEAKKWIGTKKVSEALPHLDDHILDRMMLAKNGIVNMGDCLKRYKKSLDNPSNRYLLSRALMFNLMKLGEAFYSTSLLKKPDPSFLKIVKDWFISPKIAHELRNQCRNQFHRVSFEKLIDCCQKIVETQILKNASACLDYHNPNLLPKEKVHLELEPPSQLPETLSILGSENELQFDFALEEMDWLMKIFAEFNVDIVNHSDYFQAAKMSICFIDKCLSLAKKLSPECEWLSHFGKRYAHVVADGLQWGEAEEVTPQQLILILQLLPKIKADFQFSHNTIQ